jgi:hypothetical protein
MEIKDFSNWEEYEDNSMGSGRSEKIWLTSGNGIGLFKFPKQFSDGSITTEYFTEKLAADIADLLDVPCSDVDIGTYNGRLGSMSYKINRSNEFLLEGVSFINKSYPNYDIEKLYDPEKQLYYSFQMVFPIIAGLGFEREFVEMVAFDALIGNSDRHHSNWALLVSFTKPNELFVRFSPLYDNGSSLCCYINESSIDSFLGKDTQRLLSLVTTKSKSRIRIDGSIKKEPQHTEVLEYMSRRKELKTILFPFLEKTMARMTPQKINELLVDYPNSLVSDKRKELIQRFLINKLRLIKTILEKGG